jgi:hypothetical protein
MAPKGFYDASTDVAYVRHVWRCYPTANIGIRCSTESFVALDVDPRNRGDASLAALEGRYGKLPVTWQTVTGSNGSHYYFRADIEIPSSAGRVGPGLDIKGDGLVVAPPSLHASGKRYAWVVGRSPDDVPLAPIPAWLTEAASSRPSANSATPAATWRDLVRNGVVEGHRNDAIARLSGHMLRRYIDPLVALELITTWNAVRCIPPLSETEVTAIVNRIAGKELKRRSAS